MQDDRLSGLAVLSLLRIRKHGNLMSAKLLTILQVERRGEESFEFDVSKLTYGYRKRHADMEDKCWRL